MITMNKPTRVWKHFEELFNEDRKEEDVIRIVALAWDKKEYEISIMLTAYIDSLENIDGDDDNE